MYRSKMKCCFFHSFNGIDVKEFVFDKSCVKQHQIYRGNSSSSTVHEHKKSMMKLGLYIQYYIVDSTNSIKNKLSTVKDTFSTCTRAVWFCSPAVLRTVTLSVDFKVCANFGHSADTANKTRKKIKEEIITVSSV